MEIDLLRKAYDSENFRTKGGELIELVANHLKSTQNEESGDVINWQPPTKEHQFWIDHLENGAPEELFNDLLKRVIHVHHPKYMGHQISPALPLTGLTSLMSAVLNNGMGIYEMGAAPTAMERIVTDIVCKQLGYPKTSRGILTSGGTLANLTALLSARNHFFKKTNRDSSTTKLAVMVSGEAHYCIERATKIMGLGKEGIIKIPVDSDYRIRVDMLERYYNEARENDIHVFALVGSAPSTATGIYDDIDQLQQFAEKAGIWFHIDGAHGGAAIFSTKYKHLLKGAEYSDSMIIDGHKMMMMPGITTALLFRDGQNSHQTFSQEASYLLEDSEEEDWYNLAKRTFECTKYMMSLHWYAIIKLYGQEIFDQFLTKLYDLASDFAQMVKSDSDFELAVEPMSNILCFRYVGEADQQKSPLLRRGSGGQVNQMNREIRQKLLEKGEFYIVQTVLGDTQYLRTTIMNPFSTTEHFGQLLKHLKELAKTN